MLNNKLQGFESMVNREWGVREVCTCAKYLEVFFYFLFGMEERSESGGCGRIMRRKRQSRDLLWKVGHQKR